VIDSIFKYIVGKVRLFGITDNGQSKDVSVTSDGHLEVALHAPLLPFGALHTESMTTIFQHDAVYGVNTANQYITTLGTATVTADDSSFVLSTGATINSLAKLESRKRLRYRPGQGVIGRFTALFAPPVADSYQLIGLGHAEDGFYFGYKGTDFGILIFDRGVREVRTLTVTVASTTNQNITVTLNGVANTIAVTNSGSTLKTAYEISIGSYKGWRAEQIDSTVLFICDEDDLMNGTYSITATTARGTFAQTKAGANPTETLIKQTDWNGDKMDGTGPSGVLLDKTKINIYQIGIQFLGAGPVSFIIEGGLSNADPDFVVVHTIKYPNTLLRTSIGNPCFPFRSMINSVGSTTSLTMKVPCYAGFIEGDKSLMANRYSYFNVLTTVNATNYTALFTVRNSMYYKGRSNQSVINILSVVAALKHTSPTVIYVIRNGVLGGVPNFSSYATNSCSYFDSSATIVTVTNHDQILWSGHLGDTGDFIQKFSGVGSEEVTIQPGEWVTIAAKAVVGTPPYVTASLNTREDQ
jgi:hypothetical protein